jgi:hypothetical protein
MLLGACRLKRRILVLVVELCAVIGLAACGGYNNNTPSSTNVKNRVLASQGVTTPTNFGGLRLINGHNDTIVPATPLSAGSAPGLMALSPTRNIAIAFDAGSNSVFALDTTRESSIGSVRLPGPTRSMVVPAAVATGYAAVPSATINGFAFTGAIEEMNFTSSSLLTIAVPNAQTVVANQDGSQLLVFSNDSNSMTVLNPGVALPPVDTSCYTNPPNAVCTIVTGFDRPVFAIVNGSTAYILNCGAQCGGTQASVMVFDLTTLTITNTILVDAATMAWLNGSTLYVAGTSPTNHACPQTTQAKVCGTLDVVDLTTGTVTAAAVITDGYHDRMDMTTNGQLFIGSRNCTNIGNVNNPSGEVRGCLSIYKMADGSVVFPPDNGDVNGFQGFVSRNVEYVAEGGSLRVYDTTKDILLINNFVPQGTINVVGYVGDVKAIDFF